MRSFAPADIYTFFILMSCSLMRCSSCRGMLVKYLDGKRIVNRPVLVTYMFGPDADESESMSLTQLKDRGTVKFSRGKL